MIGGRDGSASGLRSGGRRRRGPDESPRMLQALRATRKAGLIDTPFGFVFQLAQDPDGSLVWNPLAFGVRHPENPATRTVYERAHKRLHGRYPDR